MVKTTMKTPQQLLDETCAIQYVDNDVLATAPRSSEKSKVELFTVGKYITDEELEKEYEKRGLVPATLDELVSMYGTKEYIATHWKNADGAVCGICGVSLETELAILKEWRERTVKHKRTKINIDIDHVIPRSSLRGVEWRNNIENLQLAHHSCNVRKGNKILKIL